MRLGPGGHLASVNYINMIKMVVAGRMKKLTGIIIVSFLLLMMCDARAKCREVEICDDYGECQYAEVCDNSWDVPATNIAIPHVRQDLAVQPLPSLELPPAGSSGCRQALVNGYWRSVCQ